MTDTNKECCEKCLSDWDREVNPAGLNLCINDSCSCHQKKECPDGCDGSKIYTNCPFHGKVATTHTNQTGWGESETIHSIGVFLDKWGKHPHVPDMQKDLYSLLSKERGEAIREAIELVVTCPEKCLCSDETLKRLAALTHQQKEVW